MRKPKLRQRADASGPGARPGQGDEQLLRACREVVSAVNALEPQMQARTDPGLRELTGAFRARLAAGEPPDALLPEAFAAAREAAVRALGQRPFDVQVMGGAVLHWGMVAEMRTGEGKTLAATLPAYLNALPGTGVHVITANGYLARRDAGWMRPVCRLLGLDTGLLENATEPDGRLASYGCDITYGPWEQFGYDYLRDNMAWSAAERVQRGLPYGIVDEADLILIDEARSPLRISGPVEQAESRHRELDGIAVRLERGTHYDVSESERKARLTDDGARQAEEWLGIGSLYDEQNLPLVYQLQNALSAREAYQRDRDYIVENDQVVIVDAVSGRPHLGRRYAEGLHEAIEAKEGLSIPAETQTLATVSVHDYVKLYGRLAAMTGTAKPDAELYRRIYGLDVVSIPTSRPVIRVDHPDAIYQTVERKLAAMAQEAADRHAAGQPVLVGTASIEESGRLAVLLAGHGVDHEVLTAQNHEEEARIIAEAGRPGAVTVIARMAGRGTDIVLGGAGGEGRAEVADLGGLCVLGAERFAVRRLDEHLRGRAGRQGDPGESKFLLSFEDEIAKPLLRSVGRLAKYYRDGDSLKRFSIDVDGVQARQAARTVAWLAELLKYDAVAAEQRHQVYADRQAVLAGAGERERIPLMIAEAIGAEVAAATAEHIGADQLRSRLRELYPVGVTSAALAAERDQGAAGLLSDVVAERATADAQRAYARREAEVGAELMRDLERRVLLSVTDRAWREHIAEMAVLRDGIGLRALGGRSPLAEYRREAALLFTVLRETVIKRTVATLFYLKVDTNAAGTD